MQSFKKFDAKDLKSFKIKLTSMALGYSNFMHAQRAITLSIVSKLINLLSLKAFHGVDSISCSQSMCPSHNSIFCVDLSSLPPNCIKYCNVQMEGTPNIVKENLK